MTPIVEAAYTNPLLARATSSTRASVLLGATRKTRSRPRAALAAGHSPASSASRSGVMSPVTPWARASAANRSTPYRRMGFQYVMTSTPVPGDASVTAAAAVRASRTRTPPRRAASTARAMTGPSITGSVYGTPISSRSAPADAAARSASTEVATSGYPTGRYATRAARPSARHRSSTREGLGAGAGAGDDGPVTGTSVTAPGPPDRPADQ